MPGQSDLQPGRRIADQRDFGDSRRGLQSVTEIDADTRTQRRDSDEVVARLKFVIGRRIKSATLIADAKHSWLDALSSAGALLGLVGVLAGARWADPVAGLVVTLFICHVGWEVTSDVARRLMDGVDPGVITTAEALAMQIDGVRHVHARARWTGRTLRLELEAWLDADTTVAAGDALGRRFADLVVVELPDVRSLTWTTRAVP